MTTKPFETLAITGVGACTCAGLNAQQCSASIRAGINRFVEHPDYLSMTKTMRLCSEMDIHGCLLTKVDKAALLGAALSVLIESRCPLAYVSAGQAIPDDLEVANGKSLIERAVAMAGESVTAIDPSTFERAFAEKR